MKHVRPDVGSKGGQQYPVLRSIQKFLQQMAEGGARAAPTVIKELLQNADDADATEFAVILDEREPPAQLMQGAYAELLSPALLVRNSAPFHLCDDCRRNNRECEHDKRDDFHAIRDVAAGHKRAQATAAGRFGIGFNSVYFLTDTPVIFSRREVHIFDLAHHIFEDNGWRFSLDEFPANEHRGCGEIKSMLEWSFPKLALAGEWSLSEIAHDPNRDYPHAIFRIPLRQTPPDTPAIYDDRFRRPEERHRVLRDMADEAARSILFLKRVTSISFWILGNHGLERFASAEADPPPPDFDQFLRAMEGMDRENNCHSRRDCPFARTVTYRRSPPNESTISRRFHVVHSVRFDVPELRDLREKLRRNQERAVPWVAIAVPLDLNACQMDGAGNAAWRVFLPLLEEGPSSCVFNGSFFIGPSRQRIEYRLDESDEGRRRTEWNRTLVEKALLPLLRDLSIDLLDLAKDLLNTHPREYLSLLPVIATEKQNESESSLTAFVRQQFANGDWALRLPDLWNNPIEILVGDNSHPLSLEMIPDWLSEYKTLFNDLSTQNRRFLRFALGDVLAARVSKGRGVTIVRQFSPDVALRVLHDEQPPRPADLTRLVKAAASTQDPKCSWEGAWALATSDGELLRYTASDLYLLDDAKQDAAVSALRSLRLPFSGVHWITPDDGLAACEPPVRPENVVPPTKDAALELLRRLPESNSHDQVEHAYALQPVVDFLRATIMRIPTDARLGFLIRTACHKADRRRRGVILLKPKSPTSIENILWEILFRAHFAEVDPEFARSVHSLLDTRPDLIEQLHSSDCRVELATSQAALSILHCARLRHPQVYNDLKHAMNSGDPNHAQVVAAGLLEVADSQWDKLDADHRYSVLALPIHRRADGQFVPLLPAQDGDPESVCTAFRLQSDEDVHDAPVTLPDCQLLQTCNAAVRRFYRQRLGLEAHGRVAVLKEVLRQIGKAAGPANDKMLQYLVRYYQETLKTLTTSGDEADAYEATELTPLFRSATQVPCVDGAWRAADQCVSAYPVADRLIQQGWKREQLPNLLGRLFESANIARLDRDYQSWFETVVTLRQRDASEIGLLAITSPNRDLSLRERAKLVDDNRPDGGQSGPRPSGTLLSFTVPTLGGRAELDEARLIGTDARGLSSSVIKNLAPNVVDLKACAKELELPEDRTPHVLKLFQVHEFSAEDLDNLVVAKFAELWPKLPSNDRYQVLRYLNARRLGERLREHVKDLDVVQAAAQPMPWKQPGGMLAPRWAKTQPPYVGKDRYPLLQDVPPDVVDLWEVWCKLQSFKDVLGLVLEGVRKQPESREKAAKSLYEWLQRVKNTPSEHEVISALKEQAWVLASCGGTRKFCRPADVILHPAEEVLAARFLVPAVPLPEFAKKARDELGFLAAPPSTPESVKQLAECLDKAAAHASGEVAVNAYELVEELVRDSDELKHEWREAAKHLPVFRVFRQPEQQRTSLQLFIGNRKHHQDLSSDLLCLRSQPNLPEAILDRYRGLGVPDGPNIEQILASLASFDQAQSDARDAHRRLVRALEDLTKDEVPAPEGNALVEVEKLRVRTCAGTYVAISQCYWDADFGRKVRVAEPDAACLIDTTDETTKRLLEWARKRDPNVVKPLRRTARAELMGPPEPTDLVPQVSALLLPWHQWAEDIIREDSALAQRLAPLGLTPKRIEIVPVRGICVHFYLREGGVIRQHPDWEGVLAFSDGQQRLYVRPPILRGSTTASAADISQLDRAIAREIALLLGGAEIIDNLPECEQEILGTLERPSTVLRKLRETYQEHFLHQYYDQVADPRYAELFDEYRKTSRGSNRAKELEERMHELLTESFVKARRDQIRGYGYDEFSVFAELLQNAEDAYIQRAMLGMDMPSPCRIVFRSTELDGVRFLEVEHQGRPFNYWQHGLRNDPSFARDVEGVLRSAGSFKPHVTRREPEADAPTIGRFGLGFKSVYLLTDRPEIHSGAWHFAIEAGCLPEELPPLNDLPPGATRFRLPLLRDAQFVQPTAEFIGRVRNLLPFLSMVSQLELQHHDETRIVFTVIGTRVLDAALGGTTGSTYCIERVTLCAENAYGAEPVTFVRCKSMRHAGQLGMLLARDGTPARWDEAFEQDLFAVLPLKARLGCGIGVSHRFELQSGRTHLVDPKRNELRIKELAELLEALVNALPTCASADVPLSTVLWRFWALWRWDRGDAECELLRRQLARALVNLAKHASIVPTLDPTQPASLDKGPLFYFVELPDGLREAIVEAGVTIPLGGRGHKLAKGNIVFEGFAGAYRRVCEYAGTSLPTTLTRIGWHELAHAFRERAWLAEKPGLLSALAESVNDDQARQVVVWLANCRIKGTDGNGQVIEALPAELLQPGFPGAQHLPSRFLHFASDEYTAQALELLVHAGLCKCPRGESIRAWLGTPDLTTEEALGVLKYLAEESRFRQYWDLSTLFRSPWFPAGERRLSTRDAVREPQHCKNSPL